MLHLLPAPEKRFHGGNMDTETSQGTRKLRLTKKQFIIAIIAVCSIALLVEGGLLAHVFTMKHRQRTGEPVQKEQRLKSKTETRYEYSVEEGVSWIRRVSTVSEYYDEKGLVTYKTDCRELYESDGRKTYTSTDEVRYYYDKKGRIVKEDWKESYEHFDEKRGVPGKKEKTYMIVYGYRNSPYKEVYVKMDDKGHVFERSETEERYNKHGLRVFVHHYYIDYYDNGNPINVREWVVKWKYDENDRKKKMESWDYYKSYLDDEKVEKYNIYKDGDYSLSVFEKNGTIYQRSACGCGHTLWELDDKGRPTRLEFVDGHGTDKDFYIYYFYSDDDTGCIEKSRKYKLVHSDDNYIQGDLLGEMEFDSRGRILREVRYNEDGAETLLYHWEYEDSEIPGKKMLWIETYEGDLKQPSPNDRLLGDDRYLIELTKTVHYSDGTMPDLTFSGFNGWNDSIYEYVETEGTWTLNAYSRKNYDKESGTWQIAVESGFDENGNRIRTEYRGDYVERHVYDERDNLSVYREDYKGITKQMTKYEYTYY